MTVSRGEENFQKGVMPSTLCVNIGKKLPEGFPGALPMVENQLKYRMQINLEDVRFKS